MQALCEQIQSVSALLLASNIRKDTSHQHAWWLADRLYGLLDVE